MRNKRNFYRILHVQFDAPPAVIKASYRAIMQKLRAHPDLGGEEWNASLINEAQRVLLDPVLRANYDAQLGHTSTYSDPTLDRKHAQSAAGGQPYHDAKKSAGADDAARHAESPKTACNADSLIANSRPSCPFCHNPVTDTRPVLQPYPTAHRCSHCDAPLKSVDSNWPGLKNESRKINRSDLEQQVSVWDKWPSNSAYDANVCDWSTAGCCIQTNHAINVDSVVLLLSPVFDAIATVRYQSPDTFYGLEFLTLEVKMKPGSIFVSSA